MHEADSAALFKCLGDGTRLAILRILKDGDSYVELIASRLSLTPGTISFHMKKLEDAGLVRCSRTQFYAIYSLNRELLSRSLFDCLPDAVRQDDGGDAYRRQILNRFMENGRLRAIPAQLKKRELVLSHIAGEFEKEREYTEAEVNEILARYHEDVCTLRRAMIESGIMSRENGLYYRLR